MKHVATLLIVLTLIAAPTTSAHTTYGGTSRNLGTNVETAPGSGVFVPSAITGASAATPYFKTITNQTVASDYGWVAGTSPAYGDAHPAHCCSGFPASALPCAGVAGETNSLAASGRRLTFRVEIPLIP